MPSNKQDFGFEGVIFTVGKTNHFTEIGPRVFFAHCMYRQLIRTHVQVPFRVDSFCYKKQWLFSNRHTGMNHGSDMDLSCCKDIVANKSR